jgi:hypothetical protein
MTGKSTRARRTASLRSIPNHPRSVPIIDEDSESEPLPDQPFAEGAQDTIDADLRHRMISEAAFHRYGERGYADGYDLDDWLQAEAEVDHLLLNGSGEAGSHRGG